MKFRFFHVHQGQLAIDQAFNDSFANYCLEIDMLKRAIAKSEDLKSIDVPILNSGLTLNWTRVGTTAIAIIYAGKCPICSVTLLPGVDPDEDKSTLEATHFANAMITDKNGNRFEFDMKAVQDRPCAIGSGMTPSEVPRAVLEEAMGAEVLIAAAWFDLAGSMAI